MKVMSQPSHSLKLVSLFTKFIHWEELMLFEILFCFFEIFLYCYIEIIGQNQRIQETSLKPKCNNSQYFPVKLDHFLTTNPTHWLDKEA